MNVSPPIPPHPSTPRSSRVFLILLLGAGCLGVIFLLRSQRPPVSTGTAEDLPPTIPAVQTSAKNTQENAAEDTVTFSPATDLAAGAQSTNLHPQSAAIPGRLVANPVATPPPRPPATPESRQLVESLTTLFKPGNPIAPEQAGAFKSQFLQLVQQGAAGVPAILEFLDKNQDVAFGQEQAGWAGYGSARSALVDALRQIGGPDGITGTLQVMQTSGDPKELLALARNLEAMAPGEHRQEVLDAARQTIDMARQGQLQGYDVGPLFEMLHQFGGANAISDLEQASGQWKYYSAIALANLADGAGVSTLIQMAGSNGGNRGIALEMLAQVATTSADARTTLLAQVRDEKIAPNMWAYIGAVLGGDHYQFVENTWQALREGRPVERMKSGHIGFGNQNFYQGAPPGGFTVEQINQQLGLVNELMGIASSPEAQRELTRAKSSLDNRLARLAGAPSPQ